MDTKDITREVEQVQSSETAAQTNPGQEQPSAGVSAKTPAPQSAEDRQRQGRPARPAGAPANRPRTPEDVARRVGTAGAPGRRPAAPASAERRERPAGAEAAQNRAPESGKRRPSEEGQRKARPEPGEAAKPRTGEAGKRRPVDPEKKIRPAGQRTAAGKEDRRGKPAKKKKVAKPTDAQYQPYKQANKKKKAQRAGNVKKFFSPQNQILAYFRNRGDKGDAFAEESEIAMQRKARREADAARKRKKTNLLNAPAVIYTEPIAFNRDRLLVQLITVVAVVLAFVLGLSVFFKVKTITVSGAEVYSAWSVREASGIKEGDNLLTFGRARASGQITANLPYVKSVRIGIKLPDTVNIEIQEEDVVYAIKSEEGIWWLINSEGKVMEMANNHVANSHTQVLGVTLTAPKVNEIGVATEEIPTETTPDGEYIPITVTGYQRLNAALQILAALEENDIVGEAASVDVSRMEDIILWYGSRYQVNLGDASRLSYKVACMCDVILQMSDYQNGILDCSFTTWADQVGFTPFQ